MRPASGNAVLAAFRAFGVYVAAQTGGSDPAKQLRGVVDSKKTVGKRENLVVGE